MWLTIHLVEEEVNTLEDPRLWVEVVHQERKWDLSQPVGQENDRGVVMAKDKRVRTPRRKEEFKYRGYGVDELKKMIDDGTITAPMYPKVEACLEALEGGVKKAHIIDGRVEHAILLELFTKSLRFNPEE